jgi:hypothetical protein
MKIIFVALLFFAGASAQAITFGPEAKNPDGSTWFTSQEKAVQYCADKGSRLPTLAEYLEFSASKGIGQIRVSSFSKQLFDYNFVRTCTSYENPDASAECLKNSADGYVPVPHLDPNWDYDHYKLNMFADFYYRFPQTYDGPVVAPGWNEVYWTSSLNPEFLGTAYKFSGNGFYGAEGRGFGEAVRCIE